MRRVDIQQRRFRLAIRHRLAPGTAALGPAEAARAMVALHATDPATVFLSVRARADDIDASAVEQALYDERSLLRMLGMRRTMFVVPVETAPVIQAACTDDVAAAQRRRYTKLITDAGAGDASWLAEVEDGAIRALAARGEATGAQLSADEPRLRTALMLAEGKSYAAKANITSWVLMMLAAEGRIVRGRPVGSWTSSQWRWSPIEKWLPDGLPRLPAAEARAQLARLWLAAYGPATVADLKWWTGWTAAHVKQALTAIRPVEVDLHGVTGVAVPGDDEPVPAPPPWVALLPALDPTAMGWTERSWFLGPHAPELFDRSGNIGPTIWCDGSVVGGWAQRADGEIAYQLLEDIGREASAAVEAAAERLAAWLGPVRVIPRFRTPLERKLST